MNNDLSFFISMDGMPYPIRFEADVLDEFEREYADILDEEVSEISNKWFGPTHYLERNNRLGVVGQIIRDAMRAQDNVVVTKYALWVSARFPEVSGISINDDTYEFMPDLFYIADFPDSEDVTIH